MTDPENPLKYRLDMLEASVSALKQQLERYVPARENDLQLQSIRGTVERIERDVSETKRQLVETANKLILQEADSQRRDVAQRESQASLQIKVLWGIVSVVITVLTSVVIGYVSHVLH